ncbi:MULTISPECIES: RusA family crossover junction endodeoxyribonuclease [unclassified Desulfurobacterium]|uniref:RusA family crossover junction endodeoxyribonuclease n=1 Tax=Desulfurobacterium sp. TC5-1 TaxID=1158318 RepID=UPI0003B46E02|nr:RusA family crossover junction endodeoxyribonuclease [Desulfurobacterium sp. TC5-1]
MEKFRFYFVGKIPSKANYKKISHRRVYGEMKPFIINNPSVLSSQREAVFQFHIQKQKYGMEHFPIERPVKVSFSFLLSGRIKQRDIDNAEKFIGDALEKAEVLRRDSLIYVKEKVEKRLGLRRFDEIVIIDIEPLEEEVVCELEREIEIFEDGLLKFFEELKIEVPHAGRRRGKSKDRRKA